MLHDAHITSRHTWKSPIYLPFSTFPLSFITIYYKFFLIFVACCTCVPYLYIYRHTFKHNVETTTTRSCLSCFIHGYKIIIIITTKIYAVCTFFLLLSLLFYMTWHTQTHTHTCTHKIERKYGKIQKKIIMWVMTLKKSLICMPVSIFFVTSRILYLHT